LAFFFPSLIVGELLCLFFDPLFSDCHGCSLRAIFFLGLAFVDLTEFNFFMVFNVFAGHKDLFEKFSALVDFFIGSVAMRLSLSLFL